MTKLDRILLLVGVFVVSFVLVMILTFWVKGAVPDTLIRMVLGAGGLEALLCAVIKLAGGKDPGGNKIADKSAEWGESV